MFENVGKFLKILQIVAAYVIFDSVAQYFDLEIFITHISSF